MKKRLEIIIRWVCKEKYVIVLWLGFEEDHVHCLLSFPIKVDITNIMRSIKWRSSSVIRKEFREHLMKYYSRRWDKGLWAVWYFFCSVWRVNEDIVKKYVENQWKKECRGEETSIV